LRLGIGAGLKVGTVTFGIAFENNLGIAVAGRGSEICL
jgi:hypothetical protein